MCPQELVLGLKRPRRIKEAFLNSPHRCPPQISAPLFSFLALWALLLKPASSCFCHCHRWASTASCFPGECWRGESSRLLRHTLLPIFFLILCPCGSIYVYILNSMYVITKYYVTWALSSLCPDGVLCCHKQTHRLQWFNSQLEIGFPPFPANYLRL